MKHFLKQFVSQKIAPALVTGFARLIHWTCKVHITGAEYLQVYIEQQQAMLPCYWHQQMTFAIDFLVGLHKQGVKSSILVSPSKDGEIGAAVLKNLGINVLRGSAHRTGAQSIRDVYQTISKEKCSVGAAADGPLGPAFEAKSGVITLAQLSGAPIIPIANACNRALHFNSWDNFFLPLPFSTIHLLIGEPILVEKRVTAEQVTELQQLLTNRLNELSHQAAAMQN